MRCQLVLVNELTSFEAQLLHLDWNGPVLLEVIYHHPYSAKDFIQQFTEFIGNIATNYDCFQLVGDFNIHVCCQSNPLSKDLLNLIDSFNLFQWVKDSTHSGPSLDLVLSHGFAITDIGVSDSLLSDHKPILFSLSLPTLSYITTKHCLGPILLSLVPILISVLWIPVYIRIWTHCLLRCGPTS